MSHVLPLIAVVTVLAAAPATSAADDGDLFMFGGQLVRPTPLAGSFAVELGGGGALYAGDRFYWGGGGGTIFQLGDADEGREVELFHGELMIGYDVVRAPGYRVSAMALAGIGMTKQHSGVFALGEARVAARRPITHWFMLGAHLGYRRALASDMPMLSDGDLSGPILGLELYFTR